MHFKGQSLKTVFHIVQLQIIHLLNLQCNAPLTRDVSVIAESLVYCQVTLALSAFSLMLGAAVTDVLYSSGYHTGHGC